MVSDEVESIKTDGESGNVESLDMIVGTSRSCPLELSSARKLDDVRVDEDAGMTRYFFEFAMTATLNFEASGGLRSWVRMDFPTPPRPMRATGVSLEWDDMV